jgi:hypothetical protein
MKGAARSAALGVALLGMSACSRTTELFPGLTAACTSAPGPAVRLGGTVDRSCSGALAARLGRYALCTCNDLVVTGSLNVGLPQGAGGAPPPPPGTPPTPMFLTPVGTDGNVQISGMTGIKGSLTTGGGGEDSFKRGGIVWGNLHAGGEVTELSGMSLIVAADAHVATGITGPFNINGMLHVPDGATIGPEVRAHGLVREPVTVDPPCQCGAGPAFDVAAAVEARKARNGNDDLSFPVSLLAGTSTNQTLDWGCGEYYLPEIRTTDGAALELRIHGRVGIFVAGDVQLANNFIVTLDPEAELDLVVAGSLITTGRVFGSPQSPARTRLWVRSPTISLQDQVQFSAAVYAPAAVFSAGAGLTFSGTLFAGTLSVTGDVRITYDPTATEAGQACGVPAPEPVQ